MVVILSTPNILYQLAAGNAFLLVYVVVMKIS